MQEELLLLVIFHTLVNIFKVHPKFPEGTVAGLFKKAVAKNELVDAVRFDS